MGPIKREKRTAYEHLKEYDFKKRKSRRDENGKVIIGKPNVLTNPSRKGRFNSTIGHTLSDFPEYMSDPYNAARLIKKVILFLSSFLLKFFRKLKQIKRKKFAMNSNSVKLDQAEVLLLHISYSLVDTNLLELFYNNK